jgi:hypothetical protein
MMDDPIEEKRDEDPDEGLDLQDSLRERLLRQKQDVAAGERGEDFNEVARRLGLA